jgi:hypothetical protein
MNIICVKFGPKYGAEFVNKIYKDLNQPTDLYCYTDDAAGLHKEVNVIPDMGRPTLKVWWNKLRMFDKNFPLSGKTLFLDLDVKMNSSMITWNADNSDVHKIWDHFNTGFRDYYLRKYKGIDRFIVHEEFEFDTFSHQHIQSKKYQPDIDYTPIVTTFEELPVGIKDLI